MNSETGRILSDF